ncbi:TonB-dependent receptor [Pseudoxanthomonas sp.]|uniref:TonB-dependent receptor n=1 Tax=Pseudoxanthomonas sp. TaxID=1871049 RepID=UPI0026117D6A|nr:TonB-dependent receptor [Pseudoxanthomonas sp.]WDS35778.1 MAG: TonB-dependent receptor [Pseudoxanthomonas sp.]
MNKGILTLAVTAALYASAGVAFAQDSTGTDTTTQRSSVTSTSNTTNSNATKRAVQQLDAVQVSGQVESIGGGNMQYQAASKAVSTVGREAILKSTPGANFTQALTSIPGAISATNDVTGLNDGAFTVRGFPGDEVGVTVNGVPINDSGNYKIYATEYGDTENMGDITVEQGFPSVTSPVIGAAGGNIAWVTVDPTHDAGLDFSQSLGSNDYKRTFLRYNTGDTGPVRSWISYSNNQTDLWRGAGQSKVTKIDAKSIWTIDDDNSVTASLQYNREMKNNYRALTKSQIAQYGYKTGYSSLYSASSANTYSGLQTNPFRSWILSLDGEFTLTDNLHLSVVPYFVYGYGGGGSGSGTGTGNYYNFYTSDTWRPGVHVKFKQDFSENDSLEYGFLAERPRQSALNARLGVDATGGASDLWGHNSAYYLKNSAGNPYIAYKYSVTTPTERVFANNTWTPTDDLSVTVGGAYTWIKREGTYYNLPDSGSTSEFSATGSKSYKRFTPSGGVKYQLNDANQLYFGVGKTYRAPIALAAIDDVYNAAYAAATGTSTSSGNAEPEQATTADFGWRFYGDKVSTVIDAFATNFKNKQFSGSDANTGQYVYFGLGAVQMRGINGEFSYKFNDNWNLYSSYAYTEAEIKDDASNGAATAGSTLVNVPKHAGYAALNYTQGPVWASLTGTVQSGIWGTFTNAAGSYSGGFAVLSLNGGYNFNDFGGLKKPYIKLNLYNLGNRKALTYSSTTSLTTTASAATWQLLQDRTVMVTFGGSFGL